MKTWCERVSAATGTVWKCARTNQVDFDPAACDKLRDFVDEA